MLEVLHFIFSSFAIWLGTVILIAVFGTSVASLLLAARGKKDD